jgi:uncharacterized protein YjiS (DUF1127 family)
MTTSLQTLSSGVRSAPSLAHTVARWWDGYWSKRAQSATVYVLRSLDDRTLRDIGVNRSEIESVVYSSSGDRVRRFKA